MATGLLVLGISSGASAGFFTLDAIVAHTFDGGGGNAVDVLLEPVTDGSGLPRVTLAGVLGEPLDGVVTADWFVFQISVVDNGDLDSEGVLSAGVGIFDGSPFATATGVGYLGDSGVLPSSGSIGDPTTPTWNFEPFILLGEGQTSARLIASFAPGTLSDFDGANFMVNDGDGLDSFFVAGSVVVPEPTLLMLGAAILGIGAFRRRH